MAYTLYANFGLILCMKGDASNLEFAKQLKKNSDFLISCILGKSYSKFQDCKAIKENL